MRVPHPFRFQFAFSLNDLGRTDRASIIEESRVTRRVNWNLSLVDSIPFVYYLVSERLDFSKRGNGSKSLVDPDTRRDTWNRPTRRLSFSNHFRPLFISSTCVGCHIWGSESTGIINVRIWLNLRCDQTWSRTQKVSLGFQCIARNLTMSDSDITSQTISEMF